MPARPPWIDTRDPMAMALRALRDCGCISVRLGQVPPGFQRLQREGALRARRSGAVHAHLWLSDHGAALAAMLKPWDETL